VISWHSRWASRLQHVWSANTSATALINQLINQSLTPAAYIDHLLHCTTCISPAGAPLPTPIDRRHNALMTLSVCPSVCLSVPHLTLSRERNGVGSWRLTGRKPTTRVTRDQINLQMKRSKVKGTHAWDRLTSWPKISNIFGTEGPPRNFKLGNRTEYDDAHHRHCGDLKGQGHQAALRGCSTSLTMHLEGWVYCDSGHTTGRTCSLLRPGA